MLTVITTIRASQAEEDRIVRMIKNTVYPLRDQETDIEVQVLVRAEKGANDG